MNTRFFLGANSGSGFYSLYDGFARADGDFLYLIKGGPGCGKSGFMKKVAERAGGLHYDVEYILCSGDPDSLDGIYIPKLKCGLVDATAPHISEPRRFAYDSCYVNLGQFCSASANGRIPEYHEKYKRMYNSAYAYLSAAADVKCAEIPHLFGEKEIKHAEARAKSTVLRHVTKKRCDRAGAVTRRFIRCISCRGELCLEDSIKMLCKQTYLVDDLCGMSEYYLRSAAAEALKQGRDVIICPSPLCPERTDAVLIPECSLGYIAASAAPGLDGRHIRLDALIPPEVLKEHRAELKRREALCSELMETAIFYLRRAKENHDLLEAEYKPCMDFDALNEFTDEFIEKLFS